MTILLAIGASAAIAAALPADALGRWQTETRHGVVEITACGASVCGRLVDSDALRTNPQLRDERNKDTAQRNRLLKGLTILQGFTLKDGGWSGGTIYNAEDGGTYHATVTVQDHNTLRVKGCIVWPLCKSQTWKRIN